MRCEIHSLQNFVWLFLWRFVCSRFPLNLVAFTMSFELSLRCVSFCRQLCCILAALIAAIVVYLFPIMIAYSVVFDRMPHCSSERKHFTKLCKRIVKS